MILPSKELLSKVYDMKVTRMNNRVNPKTNEVYFEVEDIPENDYHQNYVNIYQLMHMMKEWVIKQDYDILSGGLENEEYSCYLDSQSTSNETLNVHYARTEFEAVTKACEWVREQQ